MYIENKFSKKTQGSAPSEGSECQGSLNERIVSEIEIMSQEALKFLRACFIRDSDNIIK